MWCVVSNVVDEAVVGRTNKKVANGEDAGVDGCIGDDVLNEIGRIVKNIIVMDDFVIKLYLLRTILLLWMKVLS